ncbi:MAG: ATP phosphoribosyltransferase regulatory subunit, partial [Gammaproteobacteria bacterium]|nr:ATP phosphoribosyltransferase regulatory subunit [Gammaproteobacteria bacterium]
MTSEDRWLLPEGVDELLPRQAAVAEQVRRDVLDLFKTWGYQLVMPPLMEFTDSLLIGLGDDIAHQSFRLTDQLSGKPMALRADITPQTARIDAHSMQASGVNRLCYAGSVLHTRPKSLLGSRCPIQAGAELFGDAGINADIEIVSLMLAMIQHVDARHAQQSAGNGSLQQLTLDLGHVGVYRAVIAALQNSQPGLSSDVRERIDDALQKKSVTDLRDFVPGVVNDPQLAEIICRLPLLCGDQAVLQEAQQLLAGLPSAGGEIQQIEAALAELGEVANVIGQRFPAVKIYYDLTELRGYAYHTGLVFAAYANGHGAALANGGRYNDVGRVFGAARAATGFNTDVKTLIKVIYGEAAGGAAAVDLVGNAIAAPSLNDAALWQQVQALRAAGDTVVFVEASAMQSYARQLVKSSKGTW